MNTRILSALVVAASFTAVPIDALACEGAHDYSVRVVGSTVMVLPLSTPRCSASTRLLRQDVTTGEVVLVAPGCDAAGAVVDSCVPVGIYRYGLETPWTCDDCGFSAYFREATLTHTPSPDCVSLDTPMPPSAVPWGDSPVRCAFPGVTPDEPPPSGTSSAGGCALGGSGAGAGWLTMALAALVLVARRRGRRNWV